MANEHDHHDHDHHDHDHDHDSDDIVILEDEEGNEHEFVIAETFEVNTRLYAVLISADATDESAEEGYIFRVEEKEDNGESYLDFVPIEDDQEWQEVESVFNELNEEDAD